MVVAFSAPETNGKDMVVGKCLYVATRRTLTHRPHSLRPAHTPRRNARTTARVPNMVYLLIDVLIVKDKDRDDGESEARRKSDKKLHGASPWVVSLVPF